MSMLEQENYPDHSLVRSRPSNSRYNTCISSSGIRTTACQHQGDRTAFHPSLPHTDGITSSSCNTSAKDISQEATTTNHQLLSSTTRQVQHVNSDSYQYCADKQAGNNNLPSYHLSSLQQDQCDYCKQVPSVAAATTVTAAGTGVTASIDNMGGVVSSVTSVLCGVTRTGNSDEVYVKSTNINGINGHHQSNNDYTPSRVIHKQPVNRKPPVNEDVISPTANKSEDYNQSPDIQNAVIDSYNLEQHQILAAQTTLDIPYADESSSSQENTPRCQHKNNYLNLNGSAHTNHSGNYNNTSIETHQTIPHKTLDVLPSQNNTVTPNHVLLKTDTTAYQNNTEDDPAKNVENTEEVIEVSEDEISADEEQDDEAEQSETEDDDGGELERVESTDKEGKRPDSCCTILQVTTINIEVNVYVYAHDLFCERQHSYNYLINQMNR